jgi:hypothetical protein
MKGHGAHPTGPSIRGPKRAATRDERFPRLISDDLAFLVVDPSVARRRRTPARSRTRSVSVGWPRAVARSLRCPSAATGGPGLCSSGTPTASHREETSGPPRFLGDPRARATLPDPGGASAPGPAQRLGVASRRFPHCVAFPPMTRRRPPPHTSLRGSIARLASLAVYASQLELPPDQARLASGWWASLVRVELTPTGSHRKVSVMSSTPLPPSPGFAWRTSHQG